MDRYQVEKRELLQRVRGYLARLDRIEVALSVGCFDDGMLIEMREERERLAQSIDAVLTQRPSLREQARAASPIPPC